MTIGLTVTWFDARRSLDSDYAASLAAGIREVLRLPTPLPLNVYNQMGDPRTGPSAVVPTIAGAYALSVGPDGRLIDPRIVGGSRAASFDDAFLEALKAVSDSGSWPAPPASAKGETMELRLAVAPIDLTTLGGVTFKVAPAEPLFRMRAPVLGTGQLIGSAGSRPENQPPRYPELAARQRIDGKVLVQLVIDSDGQPDLGSIQILDATAREFAATTLEALRSYRFLPLQVKGCRLATVVRMPFIFTVQHQ